MKHTTITYRLPDIFTNTEKVIVHSDSGSFVFGDVLDANKTKSVTVESGDIETLTKNLEEAETEPSDDKDGDDDDDNNILF